MRSIILSQRSPALRPSKLGKQAREDRSKFAQISDHEWKAMHIPSLSLGKATDKQCMRKNLASIRAKEYTRSNKGKDAQ